MHRRNVLKSLVLVLAIGLVNGLCILPCLAQETLTITTYYPSPYGSYNQLQTNSLGVGDNNNSGALDSGDVPTTAGDVWIRGKVGIGTTNPATGLHVRRHSNILGYPAVSFSGITIQPEIAADNVGIVFYDVNNNERGGVGLALAGSNPWVTGGAAGDVVLRSGTGRVILATVSASSYLPRLTILNGGNVGIGTTSPGEELSVAGDVMIGDATWSAGTTTGDLAIQGKVGIGTTNPRGALNIANNGEQWSSWNLGTNLIIRGGTVARNPAIGIFNTYNANPWAIANGVYPDGLYFLQMPPLGNTTTNPTIGLMINSAGNVGIGTETPNSTKGSGGYLDVKDVYLRDVNRWASQSGAHSQSNCYWTGTLSCGKDIVCPNGYYVAGVGTQCWGGDVSGHRLYCCQF